MFPQSQLLLNFSGETSLVPLMKLSNSAYFQSPSSLSNTTQNGTKVSFILEIQILNDPLKISGVYGDFFIKFGELNISFPIKCIGPLFKPSLELLKSVKVRETDFLFILFNIILIILILITV